MHVSGRAKTFHANMKEDFKFKKYRANVHKCASDSGIHLKSKIFVEDKREALMEDKSECINKHDIIAEIKRARGAAVIGPADTSATVIDQVFPSA